ncbi:MAG: hypothetical protein AAB605_01830 [Patescibacteria group bacterium]|mgnify:CR=1 FL=1
MNREADSTNERLVQLEAEVKRLREKNIRLQQEEIFRQITEMQSACDQAIKEEYQRHQWTMWPRSWEEVQSEMWARYEPSLKSLRQAYANITNPDQKKTSDGG